ncbi:hemerythrin domain-containing protein [Paucibacter sp. APW11]|uniref:Hemerythrin domain-containing protein n=1 Tax=Roseateles aquae TaxID=3077235 RepID=A0ABU3PCQ7_9BURK|nr:hemerythrin domain-containing protein [Paucibacter sp. APW11]MDT9000369.1 hemerythrin domain-containing protein [Paucibacter sp. APW11]
MPSPLPMPQVAQQAGSSYEAPFSLLSACHDKVNDSLALLQRLLQHLREQGLDREARDAAQQVLRYFDIAAPLHHEDEELHVFPAIDALGDLTLGKACQRLRDEHQRLIAQWEVLRAQLFQVGRLADGDVPPVLLDLLGRAAETFVKTHEQHLKTEDELIFPCAQSLLSPEAEAAMGQEMSARRGVGG